MRRRHEAFGEPKKRGLPGPERTAFEGFRGLKPGVFSAPKTGGPMRPFPTQKKAIFFGHFGGNALQFLPNSPLEKATGESIVNRPKKAYISPHE